jgi:carnitine O-palmitoyltransferase 1
VVVFANGKCGMNCEHSWADAPVAAHMMEVGMLVGEYKMDSYDESGHVVRGKWGARGCGSGRPEADEHTWSRLSWSLSREAEEAVASAVANLRVLQDDLDLEVVPYSDYGKDFVKKCSVSPDAYLQMAMQLAYYRDQGRFDNTYESSMTRLFLHGRTETVRPVTRESVAFVHAMTSPTATAGDKLRALQAAAVRHVKGYTDAMAGRGIDRHLFALYVVSVGKSVDSPFLKAALNTSWKLSTSQQPQQQTNMWDIKAPENAMRVSPGGGFGPVCDDGYGVSYMVSGEREFFFHISALKKSAPKTDVRRFKEHLFEALREMHAVMAPVIKEQADAKAAAKAKALAGAGAGAGVATSKKTT